MEEIPQPTTTILHHHPEERSGNFTPSPASLAISPLPLSPKPRPKRKPDYIGGTSTPPCTECGKRFSSWKALFGHMRCHPERQWRGINPPSRFRRHLPGTHFSPGTHFTDEEFDVAEGLLILASGPPASKFDCESCGRAFGSQQALGRHMAAHRKRSWEEAVGGCHDEILHHHYHHHHQNHRCNVCCRGFSSGQALGGHMRRHWEKGEEVVQGAKNEFVLDLNLPPPSADGNEGGYCCSIPSPGLDLKLGV